MTPTLVVWLFVFSLTLGGLFEFAGWLFDRAAERAQDRRDTERLRHSRLPD